jgi:hypothetical protein
MTPTGKVPQDIRFLYEFQFEDGTQKSFEVVLDASTLSMMDLQIDPKPEWAKLPYFQCENCPLSSDIEYCPVALNLSQLMEEFRDSVSYTKTTVSVTGPERTYSRETTLQKALSSLVGIYMVTSNCPIMDKLRPMSRFHLPFAGTLETAYRAASMYLLGQYFLKRRGLEPDWDMNNLADQYREISKVNRGIAQRLSQASRKDAGVNAVVILNSLGDSLPYFIEDGFVDLESLFEGYVNAALSSEDDPDAVLPRKSKD